MKVSVTRQVSPLKNALPLALARWFERQKRVLPWRSSPTLYRVWVSEIMLQQTQVVTVLPFFERFTQRFPTVEALAAASETEVVEAWAGLGYYSRARNLHRGAQAIVQADAFPQTREAWLEVPGVGPYTAGAIVSISLGQPEPILDGNVERVLSRVLTLPRSRWYQARLWRWSRLLVRRAHRSGISPSVFNQALMELGALVCSPKKPLCEECPLASGCIAKARGVQLDFPQKKPPKEWIRVEETRHAWVDLKSGRWLVARAIDGSWRAGLWDFLDEAPSPGNAKLLGEVISKHVVTRHKIERRTQVWAVRSGSSPAVAGERQWVPVSDGAVPGSSAYAKTRSRILAAALLPFAPIAE